MSEHLFRFLMHELKMVRVRCKSPGCGAVVEVPIEKLGENFSTGNCPICRNRMTPAREDANGFVQLARVFKWFESVSAEVEVEFTVPVSSPSK